MAFLSAANEQTEDLGRNDEQAFQASKNLVYAWVLVRVLSSIDLTRGAPLFSSLQAEGLIQLRWVFGAFLLFLWIFRERYTALLMGTAAVTIIYQFCFGYSNLGAFSFAPFYLMLLAFVFMRKNDSNLRNEAVTLISLIFLTSAVQKLNAQFLVGQEFEMTSPFMSYLHGWLPDFNMFPDPVIRKGVAALAIVTELTIGVGIFLRPAIFAHLVPIFILALGFIHPSIHYVYFFFLPLVILIPNGFPKQAISFFARPGVLVPIAYALVIKALVTGTAENQSFPEVAVLLNFLFFAFHIWGLLALLRNTDARTDKPATLFRERRSFVVPAVLIAIFAGSFWILPSPLGFNMFAARRFTVPGYNLIMKDAKACEFTRSSWRFSPVSDSSLNIAGDGSCTLRFPTKSGIAGIVNHVCRSFSATQFELRNADSGEPMNCASAP